MAKIESLTFLWLKKFWGQNIVVVAVNKNVKKYDKIP